MNNSTFEEFKKDYQNTTGFEVLDKEVGETNRECVKRNIKWFTNWAEESSSYLDKYWTNDFTDDLGRDE